FLLRGREGNKASSGEDTELCYALALCGYRIWYDPSLSLTHFMPRQRLTTNYVLRLASGIRAAEATLSAYELALKRQTPAPLKRYLCRLILQSWWLAKNSAKFLLGRNPLLVLRIAISDWLGT